MKNKINKETNKFVLAFSSILMLTLFLTSCQKGVNIIVHNQTKKNINDIHVNAGNLNFNIPQLRPQEKWQKIVNENGESSASLIFKDKQGNEIKNIAGYFENMLSVVFVYSVVTYSGGI